MIRTKNLLILTVLLVADTIGFLLLLPLLTPDIPSEFWGFIFAFLALLFVYSGIAFGLFGRSTTLFWKKKEKGPGRKDPS